MLPAPMPEGIDPEIVVEFEAPKPMISRMEEINQIKAELELGTMTMRQAVKNLHPDLADEQIEEVIANRVVM